MRKTLLLLLCVISVLLLNAQTPVNDEYTGAIEVIPSTDALCRSTASGTTIGATESMPGCFGSAEDDIWFKFTATSNRHRIVVTGDIINHVLELFNLSSGNLTSMACRYLTNPSSYGGLTAEFNTLISGTTYYYRVYGSGSSSQRGQISSCIISPPPPPANDECSGAIELAINADENCTNVYSGQFGYASQSFPAFIDKGYDAFDIWFKFTATAASHRIRLTFDDNTTTPLMQAFSGNCNNLVSIGYFTPTVQYQTQPVVGMLTNLTPGNTYYIRIYNDGSISRPNETIGLCVSSPLGAPGYQYPAISLTSPANGSTFTAPTSINLSTTVVEGEEPVQKVEFFYREGQHSDVKLGEDLTAPYEYVWNNPFPGQYRVTAKATDLVGATAISAIDITVNTPPTNQLPSATIYASSIGFAPATIAVSVMAEDIDGTISKIELYYNGMFLFETFEPYLNFGLGDASSGFYTFQAKVIDNQGGVAYSNMVFVEVNEALAISLTAPANNANFTAPATVTLEATPSGGDGTFSKVEFYNGTTKLGEDLTAPYTFNWNNVAAGTYSLTAKVYHSMGYDATSSAITITVTEPINQPPAVSLTAPANGATFTALATVSLSAAASDPDGSITKVEFYNGANKIGEDITAPYQYDWSGVSVGTYSLTAKAIDNRGDISTSTAVSITVMEPNLPPTVTLSTPLVTYGPTNSDAVTIFTEAIAYDPDGSIAKVEFYQNGMQIGVATTPPYHFVALIMTSGLYTFTAKAYDNLGAFTESTPVDVWVQRVPMVILNSPANGTTFTAPATVNLSATVDQGDAPITKVEFYNGATKLGEDLTTPYSLNWNNVGAGTYRVTARVSDESGISTVSPEVTFTVNEPPVNQLPTVALTSPANGTSFTAPASISLAATASDADGTITKVEFYNGTTKLGEDLTAPYEYSWNGVGVGTYSLNAKAIDNLSATRSSNNVSVTVSAPLPVGLVAKNSVWKYNDKGVDLGTSWTAINYNDASWLSGGGVLGYGLPVTTTLNYGNVNSKYPSYYFRRSFNVTDASIYATLVFNIRRDDGAVVYLNGVEQFRSNMPGGKVNFKTLASSDLTGNNETNYFSFTIPASQLRNGTNVIAVSVHQNNRKSADMYFDMEVMAELKTNKLAGTRINTNEVFEEKNKSSLLAKALPNPSTTHFTVLLQGSKSETIDVRVVDIMGRVVEMRRKLPASGVIKLGHTYRPGIYFVEVIQGIQRTTLKLIKSTE